MKKQTKDNGPPQRATTKAPEPTPRMRRSSYSPSPSPVLPEQRQAEQPKISLIESFTGTEVMKRWKIDDFTLSRYALEGKLKVHVPWWGRFIDPDRPGDHKMISEQLAFPHDLRDEFFANLRIPKEEVERFERENQKEDKRQLLPCQPGTKWEQITITLTADDTVRIKTPEGQGYFTYQTLGMCHKQSPSKYLDMWDLLKAFAVTAGDLPSFSDRKLISNHKQSLDQQLQSIFGIKESIYIGHAKKHGHKTRITFRSEIYQNIVEPTHKASSTLPEKIAEREDIEDTMIEAIDESRKGS